LTTAGRATFNDGVDVGVSSSTTGTLVFRNSANAGRTIIQGSTSQAASDIDYYWPTGQGSNTQVLANDGSGNLYWTATGTGNVTTAGTQTFTGTNTFGANTIRISNATNNGYHTLASAATLGQALTATFPAASGTVAYINVNQTISGANTFSGSQTFTSTLLVNSFNGPTGSLRIQSASDAAYTIFATNATSTNKTVTFPNFTGTVALTDASQTFTAAQTFNSTISVNSFGGPTGSLRIQSASDAAYTIFATNATTTAKTITFPNLSGTVALLENSQIFLGAKTFTGGVTVSTTALSVASAATFSGALTVSGASASFTVAATATATINPILTLGNSLVGVATQNVFNTVSTTINFGGAATAINIGTTTSAITGLNIGTGAGTANKTISIGTGATAGTTTINIGSSGGATNNITFGATTNTNLRFFGSTNTSGKPTVTGSRGGNAALASFLTALSNLGLITDSTTA
jgi:hypothetical protein